jgi:hypothetical protein
MALQDLKNIYGLWGMPDLAGNDNLLQWLVSSGNDAQVAQATNGWDPTSWAMHAADTGLDPNMVTDFLRGWGNQMPAGWTPPAATPPPGETGGGGTTTPPPTTPPKVPTGPGTGNDANGNPLPPNPPAAPAPSAPPPSTGGGYNLPSPTNPPSNPIFPLGPPPSPVPYTPTPPPSYPGYGSYTPPTIQAPPPFSYAPAPTIPNFTAPTIDQVMQDPSYQFRLDQGLNTLQNSAAAKGVFNDSGTAKAILDYGQNAASQEYGNIFNRDLGVWQNNAQNTLGNWLTGYNQAADTWSKNWGADQSVYDKTLAAGQDAYKTNYGTQVIDPYNAAVGSWTALTGIGQKNTDVFNEGQTGNYKSLLGQWSDYLDRLYKQQQLGSNASGAV